MAIRRYIYTLLVAFVITVPVFAQQGSADRMERRLDVLDERLDLTDEQASQIRQIWAKHHEDVQAWAPENKDATREERREYFRGRGDNVHTAVQAVLTREQAAEFAALRKGHRDRMDRSSRHRSGAGMRGGRDGRPGGNGMHGKHEARRGERGAYGRGMGGGADMFIGRVAEELELSDAQRSELQEIVENHHAEGSVWREGHPDATREQMRAHHEEHFEQLKAELSGILTSEQIQKFEELHETRPDRMHMGRGRN